MSTNQRKGPSDAVHLFVSVLELQLAMLSSPLGEVSASEWYNMLRRYDPRTRRVVILHGLLGMGFKEIGERLEISGGRADQIWRGVLADLHKLVPKFRPDYKPSTRLIWRR